MSIIKEKVRFENNDIKIKFTLSSKNGFTGYQQEIDKLTQFNTFDVVNPIVDGEKTRIKYFSTSRGLISFHFFREFDSSFFPSFASSIFTGDEIIRRKPVTQNSFFIMDLYDSFNTYSKNKIFSSYLTKIILGNPSDTQGTEQLFSNYRLFDPTTQFNKVAIPNWFINKPTTNEVTIYAKFSFYNAKTGGLIPFINFDNRNLNTPERDFVKMIINKSGKTWRFDSPSAFSEDRTLILREVRKLNNQQYVEKLNNTVDSVDDVSINFPAGNTFNINKRDYEIT